MVPEAQKLFLAGDFRVGDAEALGFADGSFDAAICEFGLLHLPEPEQGIAEVFRVLKPGGGYAFSTWYTPDSAKLLGLFLDAVAAHADMTVPLPQAPSFF